MTLGRINIRADIIVVTGAVLGFVGVLLGAAMDHLHWGNPLSAPVALHYHELYALLATVLGLIMPLPHFTSAQRQRLGLAAWIFIAGIVFFAGGIYLSGLIGPLIFGVPIGGFLLMLGWLVLASGFIGGWCKSAISKGLKS